jgi:REP element-mobilizing transposase RayT
MNDRLPQHANTVLAAGYPLAYLLTFTTYGTRLHGDQRGSVNKRNNQYGKLFLHENKQIENWQLRSLRDEKLLLNGTFRKTVRRTIEEVARHNSWHLRALNVRTNHVHIVVSGDATPELIMNSLKSWATRGLKEGGVQRENGTYWTRHGSTGYLWTPQDVESACQYVVEQQGEDLQ